MKRKDKRETKDVICNGFIYVLVKGKSDRRKGYSEPHFMGFQNWALKAIYQLKRNKKPCKDK